jgi:hypothetical protein
MGRAAVWVAVAVEWALESVKSVHARASSMFGFASRTSQSPLAVDAPLPA